jgi:hypothetical protein
VGRSIPTVRRTSSDEIRFGWAEQMDAPIISFEVEVSDFPTKIDNLRVDDER